MSHLLVIAEHIPEWVDALEPSHTSPRLPLVYAFGTAFLRRNHQLSAINNAKISDSDTDSTVFPFTRIYPSNELRQALSEVEGALFWSGEGVKTIAKQPELNIINRKIILCSYVWDLKYLQGKHKLLGISTQLAARLAKGIVVMTEEQCQSARKVLSPSMPVIRFTCGIDTDFYSTQSVWSDVPEIYKPVVEKILSSPYVIMPGSQQRCDDEMIKLLSNTTFNLVRIARYNSNKSAKLKQEIKNRGLSDRCFFFEMIDYAFLRFLFHHATVYAGLVNSNCQPAGWTVACEALASGIPVVLYEGLVSRELERLGASKFLHTVPLGDIQSFQSKIENCIANKHIQEGGSQEFAKETLNLEKTGDQFVQDIEQLFFRKN